MRLLDGFAVLLDGVPVDGAAWHRRKSAELIELLALTPGARLHRERVVDALWPDFPLEQALPRLHKAAHFARTALRPAPGILELRHDVVTLAAGHRLTVDASGFEAAARRALDQRPPDTRQWARVVGGRPPVLLPDVLLAAPAGSRARLVHHAAFGGRDRELVEIGPEAAAEAARQGAHR